MTTCTKLISDLPFAHRQPKHRGHCSLIHGHNWSFEFEFQATELDENMFVVDFGDLKWLKLWLEENFDHTLVLNNDDPMLNYLRSALDTQCGERDGVLLAKIVTVPNCGAEGLAKYIYESVNESLLAIYNGRVSLARLTVFEDSKNSATYSA